VRRADVHRARRDRQTQNLLRKSPERTALADRTHGRPAERRRRRRDRARPGRRRPGRDGGRTLADLVQTTLTLLVLAVVTTLTPLVLAVVALLVGRRTHENIGKVLGGFALLLLLGYAFSWTGALIGLSVRTPEAATSGGLIWLFPVTFISNAFVPTENMAGRLRPVAERNPFSAAVQACRVLFGNPGVSPSDAWPMAHPVWASLLWSLLIPAVFRTLSVRKYRQVAV
jgi:ABC-type multidrug transport system permease subunit